MQTTWSRLITISTSVFGVFSLFCCNKEAHSDSSAIQLIVKTQPWVRTLPIIVSPTETEDGTWNLLPIETSPAVVETTTQQRNKLVPVPDRSVNVPGKTVEVWPASSGGAVLKMFNQSLTALKFDPESVRKRTQDEKGTNEILTMLAIKSALLIASQEVYIYEDDNRAVFLIRSESGDTEGSIRIADTIYSFETYIPTEMPRNEVRGLVARLAKYPRAE